MNPDWLRGFTVGSRPFCDSHDSIGDFPYLIRISVILYIFGFLCYLRLICCLVSWLEFDLGLVMIIIKVRVSQHSFCILVASSLKAALRD